MVDEIMKNYDKYKLDQPIKKQEEEPPKEEPQEEMLKEMYRLGLNLYKFQLNRFDKLEEKASRNFTFYSFIAGFLILIFQSISTNYIPLNSTVSILLLLLMIIFFICIAIGLWSSMKAMIGLKKLCLVSFQETGIRTKIEFYKGYIEALTICCENNGETNTEITELLEKSYTCTKIIMFLFILLLTILIINFPIEFITIKG